MPARCTNVALALLSLAAPPLAADAVDDYVAGVLAEKKVPGVAVLVVRDGVVERAKGYGLANLEHRVPVGSTTVFQSGSVGKMFTAAGVLLLAEDGKLALDDRLARHFPDAPASWHRITVRHLLNHTSGLKDYGTDEIDFRKEYDEAALLAVMQKLPLEFEPGTQWSYSNSGYLVLGLLTSKLAGEHWSEFQAKRLFGPLGMKTTRVISERDLVDNRAAGYELDEKKEVKNQEWVAPSLNRCADGALYFSVEDLAAWEKALAAGKFLRPESLAAWWTPARLAPDRSYPYGMGWSLGEQRGFERIEHGGSWQGFRAEIARYPEQKLAVAVLANFAQADVEGIAHAIAGLVAPALRPRAPDGRANDPDPARSTRLRELLSAWSEFRVTPAMGSGLAATASGSARESYGRRRVGRHLAAAKEVRFLGEDELTTAAASRIGQGAERAVELVLAGGAERLVYRFLLDGAGRVLDFDAEER